MVFKTILSNYLPIGETLLSPFPSPPAPKLALLICLNSAVAPLALPRVEKRGLLFQAVFSSLFQIDFGRVLNPDLPSKMVKNHAKSPLELKTSIFENMVFYLHGSMKFKGSGLSNHPKSLGNKLQGPCERNTAFSTSFSLILGSSGEAIFALWNAFFDKKGVSAPDPSSPGGVWSIFCFFFSLFDRPWGPFNSFLCVFWGFTW